MVDAELALPQRALPQTRSPASSPASRRHRSLWLLPAMYVVPSLFLSSLFFKLANVVVDANGEIDYARMEI
jgi:hypothetical protein